VKYVYGKYKTAHRGASALYPENTLAAFEGAVELGVDNIITNDITLAKETIYESRNGRWIRGYLEMFEK